MYRLLEKYGRRIEELILVMLIAVEILDFLRIIPEEFGYSREIMTLVAFAYILYHVDLTKIFFGTSHRNIDLLLIISYFMLILKDFTAYAMAAIPEARYITQFYGLIIENAAAIEKTGFYIGSISLILIALYYTFKFPVTAPSVMHVIHEEGMPPKHLGKLAVRFATIFFLLLAFFIIVFNLMMEWLAIAIDAHIAIIAVFFYLFHLKRFKTMHKLIYEMGTAGEEFYEKFISVFKYKHTLLLGIAGMLVLHLITDIGNFIIPYTLFVHEPLYFSQLGAGHTPIPTLFLQTMQNTSIIDAIGTGAVYLLNIIGALMLLILPAYFWYDSYIRKRIGLSKKLLTLFAMSIIALIMNPAFKLQKINNMMLAGVDILTQPINQSKIWMTLIIAIVIGIIIYSSSPKLKKETELLSMGIALAFFGYYLYNYFTNVFNYYLVSILAMLQGAKELFIPIFFFFFLSITMIFYLGGYIVFVIETVKSYFKI